MLVPSFSQSNFVIKVLKNPKTVFIPFPIVDPTRDQSIASIAPFKKSAMLLAIPLTFFCIFGQSIELKALLIFSPNALPTLDQSPFLISSAKLLATLTFSVFHDPASSAPPPVPVPAPDELLS